VTYTLKADQPWLEIKVDAVWVEIGGPAVGTPCLRMRFPLALSEAKGRYEIPFGSIRRDLNGGQEVPALRWADVSGCSPSGTEAGFTLLNDCKHGHALNGSMLTLTLIRSSYEPDILPEVREHSMRLAVLPHGGPMPEAEMIRLGAGFNQPLQVVATDVHEGKLPSVSAAVASCDAPNVIVSSVRKAQDDEALIFHLFETAGKETTASVALDATMLGRVAGAEEVDFLERPVDGGSAHAAGNGFAVTLGHCAIAAVKVSFA